MVIKYKGSTVVQVATGLSPNFESPCSVPGQFIF
jgi:hypothetical protein